MSLPGDRKIPRGDFRRGFVGIDAFSLLGRVVAGQQALHGNESELRIGEVLGPVSEGQLFGFNQEVEIVGTVRPHCLEIVGLENVQHFERRQSLSIRRQFPHFVAPVVGRNRFDPFAVMILEVGFAEVSAVGLAECRNPVGN